MAVVRCLSLLTDDVEHLSKELIGHLCIFLATQGGRGHPGIQWLSLNSLPGPGDTHWTSQFKVESFSFDQML